MLDSLKYQTPDRLVQGVSLPHTQLSFEEQAGHRGARLCGPSGYSCPAPNSK